MLDIMYEIPSKKEVAECIVNEEAIQKKEKSRSLFTIKRPNLPNQIVNK